MDVFKLVFHYDLAIEHLVSNRDQLKSSVKAPSVLEDFLKPAPTYAWFYLAGTNLEKEQLGLSTISKAHDVIQTICGVLEKFTPHQFEKKALRAYVDDLPVNNGMILHTHTNAEDYSVDLSGKELVHQYNEELKIILEHNDMALWKVQTNDGFDLQLFCKNNIFLDFFYAIRPYISDNFRMFNINGKRATKERLFYFETYRIDDPPHGFQEAFQDTVL